MSRSSGTYYLIKENIEEDKLEIFNFEIMDFAKMEKRGTALSTIDSMTSLFEDEKAFENYLKREEIDEEETEYDYKILYRDKRRKKDIYLPVIWNDMNISSLSRLANGTVDYTSENNFELINKIINEIKNVSNGLAKKIATSKKSATEISDNNKKIVTLIASSKKEVPFGTIIDAFRSYKEIRALYLNYKDREYELLDYKEMLKKLKL